MEPEIIPPSGGPDFENVRVRVAHVRSLGALGAFLALMTMLAAVGFGLLMLFWRALLAAAVTVILWPFVFSKEFTLWVFGSEKAPFWKMFLLMALLGALAKALRPASWDHKP